MKKFILLFVFLIALSSSGKAQWTSFQTYFPWTLYDVHFIDANTGLAVGEQGSILRTTNGAAIWSTVSSNPGKWYTSIHSSGGTVIAVGTYGMISVSLDNGVTWTTHTIAGENKHFKSVCVRDANNASIVGFAGSMYTTVNKGVTWTQNTSIPFSMNSIDFNGLNGLIAATDGKIYRSVNGGVNWSYINVNTTIGVYEALNTVKFIDADNAIIMGLSGRILRTVNGGINWTKLDTFNNPPLQTNYMDLDIVFDGTDYTAVAVGYGRIIKSVGDANTVGIDAAAWSVEGFDLGRILYGVALVNDGGGVKGFAVGEVGNGNYATSVMAENLQVSITPISNVVPEKYDLEQNYPNPFNPSTTIRFAIPQASVVKLSVYDLSGKLIQELVNENMNAGTYSYTFDASSFTSGTYFYRLESNNFVDTKKMILVK